MKNLLYYLAISMFLVSSINSDDGDDQQKLGPDYTDKTNDTTINLPVIQVRVEPEPEALVVLPIRRTGTADALINVSPCGGIPKKKTGTLANSQTNINMIWEIRVPAQNANCTVKISPGLDNETKFTTIFPADGTSNKLGEFPCGRIQGFDTKQFKLPENYVCDQCTLQWKWMTPKGDYYSCSDITINGMTSLYFLILVENCMARCHNGGACFNGKCMCLQEFYGDFCENSYNESSGAGWIIVILILLIGLIAGAIYVFTRNPNSLLNKQNFSAGLGKRANK